VKISRFSVERPVFASMATCLVLILGGIAFMRLPVDLMPDITMPRISISTTYENASPDEVEELVTRPIEEAVAAVTGVEEMNSQSSEGRSRVTVSFAWGTDIDVAVNDVRDRLDRILSRLPDEADRPTLRKYNPSEFPVLIMGVAGKVDPTLLRQIVDDQVKYRLERVPGVAVINVRGGREREIHVGLDADKLKALRIPLDDILGSIRAGNINLPAGAIRRGNQDIRIRTPGTYTSLDELRNTLVAVHDGAPVRLSEVAEVSDSWKEQNTYILINGKPGISLSMNKQSGANTVEVAGGVLAEIEKINRDIPEIEITPIINTSKYIEDSIRNLGRSAFYGGLFAVAVLLFFLRNVRSTAIVAASIPVSIVATFLLIHFSGFTINIMTLGGLALGVGMLVDNSIVVVENILRLRNAGLDRREAALQGSEEVTSAIMASTLTTLVVFLPLVFMPGMAGVMFKQLALVVAFSLACSFAVAVSLVPMLASKLMRPSLEAEQRARGPFAGVIALSSGFFARLESDYKSLLGWTLEHRLPTALGCVLLLGGSLLLVPLVGTEMMPQVDESEVRVDGEMNVGTRVDVVRDKFLEVYQAIKESTPEMKHSQGFMGGRPWRPGGSHTGQFRISLKPRGERTRTDEQIAVALAKRLRQIPGVKIRTRRGQGLFLLRMATRGMERLSVEARGHDLEIADDLIHQAAVLIEDIPGVSDTRLSRTSGAPEELIYVDRAKAEEMKLSITAIGETLETALSGSSAGDFRQGGDEFRILVKLRDARNMSLDEVLDLTVSNSDGEPVVLRNVVSTRPRSGPVIIERNNQERIVDIRVNVRGRDIGSVGRDVGERLRQIAVPAGYSVGLGSDYEEQQKAFRELMISFVLAVILVYMVMACQFESLRDPLVVMFAVPFAAIGVILMLFLTGTTLNLQSFIGCIMLSGIVVNNAILLVDHTNLLRRRDGLPLKQAITEAGRRRLRPILMTALTTSLALVPLAIGLGEGGEAQAPMARAVIGGLLSATFITLILVPVVYSVVERGKPGHSTAT
jgi:hydrophobic/amphiphilic exporter-1 (mainly G- bacteria), HAE1 family